MTIPTQCVCELCRVPNGLAHSPWQQWPPVGDGTTETPDMVNRPPHYTSGKVECIDAIRAALGEVAFLAYCRGQVIKYLWRAPLKFDAVEDMKKAQWYLTTAIEVASESTD